MIRCLIFGLTFVTAPLIGGAQTLDSVKTYIYQSDLEHKDIVYAQAILETGWLKCSKCSLDGNNLFGWFYKGRYLRFDTWQESVDYYVWWQDKVYKGGDYCEFLTAIHFYTSANYIREIKKIVNDFK